MIQQQQPPQLSIEMKEMETSARHIITSYGETGFSINSHLYAHPIVFTPTQIWNWSIQGWEELTANSFAGLENIGIEIFVIGVW